MSLATVKQAIRAHLPKHLVDTLQSLSYAGRRLPDCAIYKDLLRNKSGIEIGGPSPVFWTTLPIYQVVDRLDGVNFADHTVWEGAIRPGRTFNYFGGKTGEQFLCDATELGAIPSEAYDFVLSSNCLEHVANPLKALAEWRRVIKNSGLIVLVLPDKRSNFDHKRSVTSFQHLLDDYRNGTTEHDLTHLDEILALHDLSLDPAAGTLAEFRQRSLQNFDNRTLHHHVFDVPLMEQILRHLEFEVITTGATTTDLFALGAKR